MTLLPADWVWCGVTAAMAVTGLFRGFSGTLAFVLAVVAAALAGVFGWPYSTLVTETVWLRGAAVLVAVLLTFGLVRLIVKKLVNGLLAQPSDALMGALVGALLGVFVLLGWAYSGLFPEYSNLAKEVSGYVR